MVISSEGLAQQKNGEIIIGGRGFEVDEIYADSQRCTRTWTDGAAHRFAPRGEGFVSDALGAWPICIEASNAIDGLLPRWITVNGKPFCKRIGPTFTPLEMDEAQIEHYFDVFAERYDTTITLGLNAFVYGQLFKILATNLATGPIHLLDFGVGTGSALARALVRYKDQTFCNRLQLSAVDLSREMVKRAKQQFSILNNSLCPPAVFKCEYGHISLPKASVDAVTACFVVHSFADDRPFSEMRRILRRGGYLAFNLHHPQSAQSQENTSSSTSAMPPPVRRNHSRVGLESPDVQDYIQILSNAGFSQVKIHQVNFPYQDEVKGPSSRHIKLLVARAG